MWPDLITLFQHVGGGATVTPRAIIGESNLPQHFLCFSIYIHFFSLFSGYWTSHTLSWSCYSFDLTKSTVLAFWLPPEMAAGRRRFPPANETRDLGSVLINRRKEFVGTKGRIAWKRNRTGFLKRVIPPFSSDFSSYSLSSHLLWRSPGERPNK